MNSLVNSWQQAVLFAGTRPNIGLIIFMEYDFGVFRVKRFDNGSKHGNWWRNRSEIRLQRTIICRNTDLMCV